VLAAAADDRLDELPVGVLVGALDQFAERLLPIGRLVVRAPEIERPDGVVRRVDQVDRIEAQPRHFQRVAQGGRFGRRLKLSQPASQIHPRHAQPMRGGSRGDRADDNRLRRAGSGHFLEQPIDDRRSIAEAVRLPAPEAVGGEGDQRRVRQQRRRHARRHHVERVLASDAGEIEHLRPSIAPGAGRHELAAKRLAQQGRDDVAPRIDIGGDKKQLGEPGLAEALEQHFRVAPRQRLGRRAVERRRATNQLPDGADEQIACRRGLDRGPEHPPPPAAGRSTQWRCPATETQQALPAIKRCRLRRLPDAVVVPETRAAIDGRQRGAGRTDALAGDQIDLDARFMQRAQDAGVIRAVRARATQDQRSATRRTV
jgi:hypothetical protein